MGFMVCLFCYLDVLCLWVERVQLGKITRLWTAATAILAELDKEIGLKSNFGQILYKWKNGNNIQVLLTTKATFFDRAKNYHKWIVTSIHLFCKDLLSTLEVSGSLPESGDSEMARQKAPHLHEAHILLEYEKQSNAVNMLDVSWPTSGASELSPNHIYYYYDLFYSTSPSKYPAKCICLRVHQIIQVLCSDPLKTPERIEMVH